MATPTRTLIEHLDFALTVDSNDTCLRDASIVVEGDRIAAIGPAAEVAAQPLLAGGLVARRNQHRHGRQVRLIA